MINMNTIINIIFTETDPYIEKKIIIEDGNKNLVDCILEGLHDLIDEFTSSNADKAEIEYINSMKGDYPTLDFSEYYLDYEQMIEYDKFPYVLKDGVYNWGISFDKVSIDDFIETHDLQSNRQINVLAYYSGGGDGEEIISNIIDWIIPIYLFLKKTSDVYSVFDFAKKIYNYFREFKNEVASYFDVIDLLEKKDEWNYEDLRKRFYNIDQSLLEMILIQAGFEKKGSTYCKACNKVGRIDNSEEDLFGESSVTNEELEWLSQNIYYLNRKLTSIFCQLYCINSDLEVLVNDLIESYLSNNSDVLKRGSGFKYVEFEEDLDDLIYDEERIEEINDKTDCFMMYLNDIENYIFSKMNLN